MNNTATEHHVVGINRQVVDDLTDRDRVAREIPHGQRQRLRIDQQLGTSRQSHTYTQYTFSNYYYLP